MTETITFERVVPILRIFDLAKADEFYVGYLGFQVDWNHRFDDNAPLYRQVSRGDLVLHLSEHHGDGSPGARLRVRSQNAMSPRSSNVETEYRSRNRNVPACLDVPATGERASPSDGRWITLDQGVPGEVGPDRKNSDPAVAVVDRDIR